MVYRTEVESLSDFCERLSAYFTAWKRYLMTVVSLSGTVQRKKDTLQSYIDFFMQVIIEAEGAK